MARSAWVREAVRSMVDAALDAAISKAVGAGTLSPAIGVDASAMMALRAAPSQRPGPLPGKKGPRGCTCPGSTSRIALGLCAGQKVLSLHTVTRRAGNATRTPGADAHGFSLRTAVHVDGDRARACDVDLPRARPELSDLVRRKIVVREAERSSGDVMVRHR